MNSKDSNHRNLSVFCICDLKVQLCERVRSPRRVRLGRRPSVRPAAGDLRVGWFLTRLYVNQVGFPEQKIQFWQLTQ